MSQELPPVPPRRVAITGMGVACGLGVEVEEFWSALLAGEHGIGPLSMIPDDMDVPVRIGGLVPDEELQSGLLRYGIREPDRPDQLGLYSMARALDDAGFATDGSERLECDVISGSAHGCVLYSNEATRGYWTRGGWRRMRPTGVLRTMFNRAANLASVTFGLVGSSYAVSAACASAMIAMGEAFLRIRFGIADRALAASNDCSFDASTYGAWSRLGVLSRIPEPGAAMRPFDRGRQGMLVAEGGAAFVMEAWDVAEARGADVLAEVVGYGSVSTATNMTQPEADGQARSVRAALAMAGLSPEDIDYVNAHGTATEVADVVEAESLLLALGEHGRAVPVSGIKGQLGHMMGATAGVETAATIEAMRHGVIPPNANLDDPDPRCPLAFVRGEPLRRDITYALKNPARHAR